MKPLKRAKVVLKTHILEDVRGGIHVQSEIHISTQEKHSNLVAAYCIGISSFASSLLLPETGLQAATGRGLQPRTAHGLQRASPVGLGGGAPCGAAAEGQAASPRLPGPGSSTRRGLAFAEIYLRDRAHGAGVEHTGGGSGVRGDLPERQGPRGRGGAHGGVWRSRRSTERQGPRGRGGAHGGVWCSRRSTRETGPTGPGWSTRRGLAFAEIYPRDRAHGTGVEHTAGSGVRGDLPERQGPRDRGGAHGGVWRSRRSTRETGPTGPGWSTRRGLVFAEIYPRDRAHGAGVEHTAGSGVRGDLPERQGPRGRGGAHGGVWRSWRSTRETGPTGPGWSTRRGLAFAEIYPRDRAHGAGVEHTAGSGVRGDLPERQGPRGRGGAHGGVWRSRRSTRETGPTGPGWSTRRGLAFAEIYPRDRAHGAGVEHTAGSGVRGDLPERQGPRGRGGAHGGVWRSRRSTRETGPTGPGWSTRRGLAFAEIYPRDRAHGAGVEHTAGSGVRGDLPERQGPRGRGGAHGGVWRSRRSTRETGPTGPGWSTRRGLAFAEIYPRDRAHGAGVEHTAGSGVRGDLPERQGPHKVFLNQDAFRFGAKGPGTRAVEALPRELCPLTDFPSGVFTPGPEETPSPRKSGPRPVPPQSPQVGVPACPSPAPQVRAPACAPPAPASRGPGLCPPGPPSQGPGLSPPQPPQVRAPACAPPAPASRGPCLCPHSPRSRGPGPSPPRPRRSGSRPVPAAATESPGRRLQRRRAPPDLPPPGAGAVPRPGPEEGRRAAPAPPQRAASRQHPAVPARGRGRRGTPLPARPRAASPATRMRTAPRGEPRGGADAEPRPAAGPGVTDDACAGSAITASARGCRRPEGNPEPPPRARSR
ncbi:collagen alpha-1(I) chain-like [Lepus europaeus]|uniref:collagen alpha-1(I) chain-like n=1 Tax=Lepus europaeus TaxID=9983 RepID=UPI002B484B44|nr:collagen alpha-1(I) chain-like [Lepus europaeus]